MTRIFTYRNQPTDNVLAIRLGAACRFAADDRNCGDLIDRGLILLRELQDKGFGVVLLTDIGDNNGTDRTN